MNAFLMIRADATPKMGSGHLLRCLALAQAWRQDGGKAVFLTYCDNKKLSQRVMNDGFEIISIGMPHPDKTDLDQTIQYIEKSKPDWCVLDGEHFDPAFQRSIRKSGIKLLVVDDFNRCAQYHADILLNQNFNADVHKYNVGNDSVKLLGIRYVMLRQEFYQNKRDDGAPPSQQSDSRNILFTFGGSDPNDLTGRSLRMLATLKGLNINATVLVGGGNSRGEEYEKIIADVGFPVELVYDAKDTSSYINRADLSLICAGGTLWECLYLGCPVISFSLNGVQHDILTKLDEEGAAIYLGRVGEVTDLQMAASIRNLLGSDSRRAEMRRISDKLLDGEGCRRVIEKMKLLGVNDEVKI